MNMTGAYQRLRKAPRRYHFQCEQVIDTYSDKPPRTGAMMGPQFFIINDNILACATKLS